MKTIKKSIAIVLSLVLLLVGASFASFAANDISVNVRVEGIKDCLFYGDVTVPAGSTALDAIKKADKISDDLTVSSVDSYYGEYINAVNDEKEKTFGGWDGWNYRVNGAEPTVSISEYKIKEESRIVLYYGDPYGEGMQYPVADTSSLAAGQLSFKSTELVYNDDGTTSTKTTVVKDYILVWGVGNGATVDIYPDENGIATIFEEYLTPGAHTVQLIKKNSEGLPLALRLAPDYEVTVKYSSESMNELAEIVEKLKEFIMQVIEMMKSMIKGFQDMGN